MEKGTGNLWRENFVQAIDIIRSHRMRSGLLILGVAIGITTILMMVTVLSGLSRKINEDMVAASRPYIYVQKYDFFVSGEDEAKMRNRKDLTREDARAIEELCPSVDVTCFLIESNFNYVITYGGERTPPTNIVGADHTFPEINTFVMDAGRNFTAEEVRLRKRVIVLGHGPASDLFPNVSPVGKFVRIAGERYEVVGTYASRNHLFGSLSDNFVAIPQTTFQKDIEREIDAVTLCANVLPGRSLEEGEEEVRHVLRMRRGVKPGEEDDFAIGTSDSFLDLVRRITVPIGIVLTIIASIGLVVGGIGVMNIMLISVAERTREIGVRRALGAGKNDILLQFLVEAGTLTGIGGVVGTLMGTLAAYGVSHVINFPFGVSVPWTVISVVFSALVGIVFGLYPARRAAGMDPVNALRYE